MTDADQETVLAARAMVRRLLRQALRERRILAALVFAFRFRRLVKMRIALCNEPSPEEDASSPFVYPLR